MYFRPRLDYQLTSSLLGIYNVLYYRSELDYQLTSSLLGIYNVLYYRSDYRFTISLVYPTFVDVSQISNITGSPSTAISCLYLNKHDNIIVKYTVTLLSNKNCRKK